MASWRHRCRRTGHLLPGQRLVGIIAGCAALPASNTCGCRSAVLGCIAVLALAGFCQTPLVAVVTAVVMAVAVLVLVVVMMVVVVVIARRRDVVAGMELKAPVFRRLDGVNDPVGLDLGPGGLEEPLWQQRIAAADAEDAAVHSRQHGHQACEHGRESPGQA